MNCNAFQSVRDFESRIAEYSGSKYAVSTNSCTSAIFLSLMYLNVKGKEITLPKRTYVSVPCMVRHAGATIKFEDLAWEGTYKLKPFPVVDGAKRFRKGMYEKGTFHCLSFHARKILNIGTGGMILTDNKDAVDWLKQARYDGRSEVPLAEDNFTVLGWNMYLTPELASRGLWLMMNMPDFNEDQQESPPYPDLSQFPIFTS